MEFLSKCFFGCSASNVSFLYLLYLISSAGGFKALFDGAQEYRVEGGTHQMSLALVELLGEKNVFLNSVASVIDQTDDVISVQTRDLKKYFCKDVIIAMPPMMAQK